MNSAQGTNSPRDRESGRECEDPRGKNNFKGFPRQCKPAGDNWISVGDILKDHFGDVLETGKGGNQ